jgi:hypothetical protein
LGFLPVNNLHSESAEFEYNLYEPFGRFNTLETGAELNLSTIASTGKYYESFASANAFLLTRNYFAHFGYLFIQPFGRHDWYEPRTPGYFYDEPARYEAGYGFSMDYRKTLAVDAEVNYGTWNEEGRDKWLVRISPRLQAFDRLLFTSSFTASFFSNNVGYVANEEANIIFGQRNYAEYSGEAEIRYSFSSRLFFNGRVRHYVNRGRYSEFYSLQADGSLLLTEYNTESDYNFTDWSIDASLNWWFAPGSEINLVWKNDISGLDNQAQLNYYQTLQHTFGFPQVNNVSIRIRYYLDYQETRNLFL